MKRTAKRGRRSNAKGNVSITDVPRTNAMGNPFKAPTGKGLGKGGAKRLGRLLKRAIQQQQPPGPQQSLPKTAVRLLKHQMQSANSEPQTNAKEPASPRLSKLILSMVSQCKRKDGLSMGELKQTLAAEGFNVTKNDRQVKVVTKTVVNCERFVRTTRNAALRINKKTMTDIRQVKMSPVTPAKPKGELKQSTTAHKSPKGAERPQRRTKEPLQSRSKWHTTKRNTRTAAKSSRKPAKRCKPPAKSNKKRHDKRHNKRTKTTRARRKPQKAGGKKRNTAKKQTRSRKPRRKPERRRQAKRNQY